MEDINVIIGRNIRTERKKRMMTISGLADELARVSPIVVCDNAIGRWERGQVVLQAATVYYLAKAMRCRIVDLMPREEWVDE